MTSGRQRWLVPSLAALVVLGSAWLFLGVLEDVVTQDPLVEVDVVVHAALQSLRTPVVDGVMVALTELGDVAVVLPLALAALAWFVWHRLWQTSLYWLAAVGVAELLVKMLKWALHRPRPDALYAGLEQYSFPSGHATLSVVVYGFLAFLLCRGRPSGVARRIGVGAALLVGSIAFSRLYLGVHWASDVIAGASLGLAWVGALAMVYRYRTGEDVKPRQLAVWLVMVAVLAGSWHVARQHRLDLQRYAPVTAGPGPAHARAAHNATTLPRWQVRFGVLRSNPADSAEGVTHGHAGRYSAPSG